MRLSSSPLYMTSQLDWTDGNKLMHFLLDFSKAFDKVPHQRLAVKLHYYGIRDKNLSWIQNFLADRNQQVVLDGRHHLVLLSHLEFHKAQCLDLSCSWYTSMTCPQEFPLQYDFLLMIVICTESYETNRMQRHYRQILIIYRNGKKIGKWFLTQITQTSANISGSPTSEMSYRLSTIVTDRS